MFLFKKQTLKSVMMVTTAAGLLSGCAAISTEIQHGKLQTQSKMSRSIFLDPVASQDKVIYVQVHDTSAQDVNLTSALVANLKAKGWRVTRDLSKAHDLLQVNVLQAGKAPNMTAVWQSMNAGFGSTLIGSFAGVAAGLSSNDVGTGLGVGMAAGAVSWMANQLVKNVTYSMMTDIQVSVRLKGEATENVQSNLSQGTQTVSQQSYQKKTHWLHYRTRVASVANQVNLKFVQAKPLLVKQVSHEIAGIFD